MKYLILLLVSFFSFSAVAEESSIQPSNYIFNISYQDAEEAISKSMSEKNEDGKKISAVINNKKSAPLYSSNKPIEVEVRGLRTDKAINRWSASMVIISEDKVISALPLAGRYMVMNEVPVLKKQVRSGEMISDDDVEMHSFPEIRIGKDTVTEVVDLVGRTPIRTVSPNRPIRVSEISAPSIVKKNALVQMRYKTPNMEITTSGQAVTDGAKGDVIEVRNLASKKTTFAVVTESNIVDVVVQGVQTSAAKIDEKIYAEQ